MALSKEDKADVKGAFGKAIAKKISSVTHDKASREEKHFSKAAGFKAKVSVSAKPSDIGHTIEDHKGNVLKSHEGKGRHSLSSALAKKSEYTGKKSEYTRPHGGAANFMKIHKLDR